VIDGAMVPWEVAPALKLQEVTKYHLDTATGVDKMSNSIFVIAMNPAKYDSLPPDLKKILDANTGLEFSKQIGKVFDGTTDPAKKLAAAAGGVFDTLSPAEFDRWKKATDGVEKDWFSEVAAKGGNGPALLEDARALIKKNGG